MMDITKKLCDIVQQEFIDNKTVKTTYKINGGGIVNVKSIFGSEHQFKDAIFPAILTILKFNEKV